MLWDPRTRSEIGRWRAHETVHFVAFSADSSLLIGGRVDHTDRRRRREVASIKVWEAHMWQNRLNIDFDYAGGWLHGSVSPREPYVAGKTGPSEAAIWNYQTGEQLFLLKGHYSTVYSTLFSPDGSYLASSSQDGSIRIWDVQTGRCVRHIIQYKDCEGAYFTNIKGLDARTCEWLRDRGAII
jgi:WD40 repeat protein